MCNADFYDLSSSKSEFQCQYVLIGLKATPISLDYWSNPENPNESLLVWGDTAGGVTALFFSTAMTALFERSAAQEKEGVHCAICSASALRFIYCIYS